MQKNKILKCFQVFWAPQCVGFYELGIHSSIEEYYCILYYTFLKIFNVFKEI